MELYEEKVIDTSLVPITLRKIILNSPEPYEKRTVILVSARFLQEARAERDVANAALEPDVGPDDGYTTIRGYPVVAVPWFEDGDFEYWSNAANYVAN